MFKVRETRSGRTAGTKYLVFNGAERVSVHAHAYRVSAQREADELNIAAMVKDHAEDPRPYAERLSEAREAFRKEKTDASRCHGCGVVFDGPRGLKAHQTSRYQSIGCKPLN